MHGQAWMGLLLRTWPSWHTRHPPRQARSAVWKAILKTLTVCSVDMGKAHLLCQVPSLCSRPSGIAPPHTGPVSQPS